MNVIQLHYLRHSCITHFRLYTLQTIRLRSYSWSVSRSCFPHLVLPRALMEKKSWLLSSQGSGLGVSEAASRTGGPSEREVRTWQIFVWWLDSFWTGPARVARPPRGQAWCGISDISCVFVCVCVCVRIRAGVVLRITHTDAHSWRSSLHQGWNVHDHTAEMFYFIVVIIIICL